MASVRGTSIVFDTASGTHQATSTATLSDYIVILAAHTGSTAQPTITDSSGGTYSVINSALKASSADKMWLFVRNALVTATGQISFTVAPGATSGGGFNVFYVSGMQAVGTAAVKQSASIANIATTSTMSITFAAAVNTGNLLAGGIFNSLNTAAVTAPSGFTKDQDVGYNTPATGMATWHHDSGSTASAYFSGSTSRPFGALMAELDASSSGSATATGVSITLNKGTILPTTQHAVFGTSIASAQQQWPNVFVDGIRGTEAGAERITEQGQPNPGIQRITEHFIASGATATGISLTFSTGNISQVIRSVTLTGKAVATATGKLTPTIPRTLLGKAVATATGNFARLDHTQALLGKAVTTAQGTFVKAHVNALAGKAVSLATGILTYQAASPDVNVTLTGKVITTATGTMAVVRADALLGKSAAFAQGTMANVRSDALVGQAATFSTGATQVVRSDVLLGQAGTFATGILADVRTTALLGKAVASAQGTFVKAHTNLLAGKVVNLSTGNVIALSGQSVLLTGQQATFSTGQMTVTNTGVGGAGGGFFPVLRPRHRHRR